jgi:hypothetical protein
MGGDGFSINRIAPKVVAAMTAAAMDAIVPIARLRETRGLSA